MVSKRTNIAVILAISCALVGVMILLGSAKKRARQLNASSRLSQMKVALQLYENEHGTLPPLYLKDNGGTPIQSWRTLMLPYLGGLGLTNQLDLSQPWNSGHNRRLADSIPPGNWIWFALDRSEMTSPVSTHILAYLGPESIWDAKTGHTKGRMTNHPNAILLIWIPKSKIHPLEPRDITKEEVRERVQRGQKVLYMSAGGGVGNWGVVTIEGDELVFRNRYR